MHNQRGYSLLAAIFVGDRTVATYRLTSAVEAELRKKVEPVSGMLQVPGAGYAETGAAGRRQVGGGGEGRRQAAAVGSGGGGGGGGRSAGTEQTVPGRVGGAAERRRAGRVGELDGDGLEQRAAGARLRRHDAVELLDGALGLVTPVEPHEPDALRQTCQRRTPPSRLCHDAIPSVTECIGAL